ncbi:MAG: hypothetical protein WCD12_09955 [Candidatus Binatus sp.]|jgi:hypothetical protein|uniref:hypothetical protein n=1 Tax=Candidatus Binatus sp. TaxID=2811406 RepID=UPI003C7550AE
MQVSKRNDPVGAHVLDPEIAAFEQRREELERTHLDEFALFFEGKFVGVYPDFDSAGRAALAKSKTGPFLIQQIGRPIGLDPDSARHLSHR